MKWNKSMTEDPKGKKSITLKSNADFDYTNLDDDIDDEELALLIKKFKKLNRKGRRFN